MIVKIIQAENAYELEKEVNHFLYHTNNDDVIDIKYLSIGSIVPDQPSVMIILK